MFGASLAGSLRGTFTAPRPAKLDAKTRSPAVDVAFSVPVARMVATAAVAKLGNASMASPCSPRTVWL